MSGDRFLIKEIAEALGVSRQAADKRSKKESWGFEYQNGRGGRRRIYPLASLPTDVHAALLRHYPERCGAPEPAQESGGEAGGAQGYDRDALWQWYEQRPATIQDQGRYRAGVMHAVDRLVQSGTKRREALAAVARQYDLKPGTVRNWWYGANGNLGAKDADRSDWPAVLAPRYTGRTKTAEIEPEAWEQLKADYLRPEQPTFAACYERLQRTAAERGWQLPSIKTLERRLNREVPHAVQVKARQGDDALKALYPAQERDRTALRALEAVNADGHKFDVFVQWPDGEVGRPVMLAWQDLASGKILSWRVDRTENQDQVRLSFGDLVRDFGIPDHAYLDNGHGFASKWITGGARSRFRFKVKEEEPTGILKSVGCEPHWATPYSGQSKPIERAFKDLTDYISRHPRLAGAYTGNRPDAKPENHGSRAVDFETFVAVVNEEIRAHNAREGRRSAVANGRSFDQVFQESYERSVIRQATPEQQRLFLLTAEQVRLQRNNGEVVLSTDQRNRYWTEELVNYAGQSVAVRFDPDALHSSVHVYALDGRYLAEAECIQAAGFQDTEAARHHGRARRQYKKAVNEQLEAERRMTAAEVADRLPEPEEAPAPETKTVRLVQADHIKPAADGTKPPETEQEKGPGADPEAGAHFSQAMRKLRKSHRSGV